MEAQGLRAQRNDIACGQIAAFFVLFATAAGAGIVSVDGTHGIVGLALMEGNLGRIHVRISSDN